MRILWASNWSAQSSYALQSQLFVPRLKAMGYDVTVFELSNGTRRPYQDKGITIVPAVFDALGNDIVRDHVIHLKADVVITLMDVWRFNPNVWSTVPWFPWTPVDHTPVPPGVIQALAGARRVIAMSQFGAEELRKVDIEPLYVPLAYDPDIWHPMDKVAVRRELGLPEDVFWVTFVGVNDSNPSRKGIPELLSAWQSFAPSHRDAVLYLHTASAGNLAINGIGGVRIDQIIKTLHLDARQLRMVDEYEYRTGIPTKKLAKMVAASDVVILPSRGEGFGLPLLEAQASGVPVITTRFAAQEELLKAGWYVEGESEWSYQDAFAVRPGILSTIEALDAAYAARGDTRLSKIAADSVKDYAVDTVTAKYWPSILEQLAETTLEALCSA
jgi:glycosyltransferase involved in cell wall biosynthesis